MGEMSSMVSRRPPVSGSTSQSKDLRWISMGLGTSRTLFRRAKLRRVLRASTRGKTATPRGVEKGGQSGRGRSQGARPSKIAQREDASAGSSAAQLRGGRRSRTPPYGRRVCGAAPVLREREGGYDYWSTAEG